MSPTVFGQKTSSALILVPSCLYVAVVPDLVSRREVLLDGELGVVVDPDFPSDLIDGIVYTLSRAT